MFLIRQAGRRDFAGVFPLARILDSYNLPADRRYIRQLLATSQDSFAGRLPLSQARYLFVLEERGPRGKGGIVGCSLIIAKHGTPGRPHLWFALDTLEKKSRTLRVCRRHTVLRLGFTEDGPTEVGGLVMLPGYRKRPEACGMQISFVRFLYMAIHPQRFGRRVLVEYRGAMGRGNKSPFWEAVGRLFTGLSYKRADRLSVANKEFILGLMPREPIYCALLPKPVQAAIGAIHPSAQRAASLLQSVGFRRLPQIEPFDGGPYYASRRGRIRILSSARRCRLGKPLSAGGTRSLVATQARGTFRAAVLGSRVRGKICSLPEEGMRLLRTKEGDPVYVYSLSR